MAQVLTGRIVPCREACEAGGPGIRVMFFVMLLCFMSNKKYTLVAWTEKGQVRMIPSLVNEVSRPYRENICRIENRGEMFRDKVAWLHAQSRAHEKFALFLLRVGHPREAYVEFENAAEVCTWCPDERWNHGDEGSFPELSLCRRFLSMHAECRRLALADRFLQISYEGSCLQRDYRTFTLDFREADREIAEAVDTTRAWNFGKS